MAMDVEAAKKRVEIERDGIRLWYYDGKEYIVPIFGANAPDKLLDLADQMEGDKLHFDTHRDLANFFYDFCYTLLSIRNDVSEDEIRSLSNKRSYEQLYSLWIDNDQKKTLD